MYNPIWCQPEAKFIDINAFPKIEASETFNFSEWMVWLAGGFIERHVERMCSIVRSMKDVTLPPNRKMSIETSNSLFDGTKITNEKKPIRLFRFVSNLNVIL